METVKIFEPRVNIKSDLEQNHLVRYGGLRVNQQVHAADSYSSSQALWTINPPSTDTIIDRQMKIRAYIQVVGDVDFTIGSEDALRQFPISSITDVLTVQINGETISDNLADKLGAMLCYGNDRPERNKSWSTTACMPDNYKNYNDWKTYGSGKNPLADYGENSAEDPRGGFPSEEVDSKTFKFVITEPLLLSPFFSGLGEQKEGFVNVNQFNIAFRWKSDLSRVWSSNPGASAPLSTVTVSFYQAPEILATYITPNMSQSIPALQVLPYHKPQEYIKSMSALADGSSASPYSDTIKLAQIPRKMYVFARRSRATSTFLTTDSYLKMTGINVTWNNQSGLLSSATEQDLYEMSRRNGCNLSWGQWSKYRGAVACFEFGKDIGLLDSEASGTVGQYTIQVNPTFKNDFGASVTPEFYLVFVYEGTFSISENMGRASLGNLTPQAVLMAKESDELPHELHTQLEGGGFFTGLKHIVNKVSRGVQTVGRAADVLSGVAPELAPLGKGLQVVGQAGRIVSGGGMAGGRFSGGNRRVMSRRR